MVFVCFLVELKTPITGIPFIPCLALQCLALQCLVLKRRYILHWISINFPHIHYCLKATKSEIKPLESSCSMATLSYIGILFSHSTLVPTGVNKSKQNLLEKTIKKSSITYLIPNKRPSSLYLTQWVKIIYKTQIVDIHEIL